MDLDQADVEPPPSKKPRRSNAEHDSDADDEDDIEESQPKRVRFDEGPESFDYGHDSEAKDLFAPEDDEAESISHFIHSVYLTGVDRKTASAKAKDIIDPNTATFMELDCRGAICRQANQSRRDLNVQGLGALDLRTSKPDGTAWDFTRKSDRNAARDKVRRNEPDFIIGSPPCTAFCAWNHHMNFCKMDPEQVRFTLEEGRVHLQFLASLYQLQIDAGRFFVHEHPATSVSRDERCIVKLLAHNDVHLTKSDQCQFGLSTPEPDGRPMPALKPTKFMTNSAPMAQVLSRTCKRDHTHQPLTGGRCATAVFYPLPLVRILIKGIRLQKNISKSVVSFIVMVPVDQINAVTDSDVVAPGSKFPKVGGGHVIIAFDSQICKPIYRDEYTNEVLPEALVRAAICEELTYFSDRVW